VRIGKRLSGNLDYNEHLDLKLCEICELGHNEDEMILCDHCDKGFHIYCLKPALPDVPEGMWFCKECEGKVGNSYTYSKDKLSDLIITVSSDEEDVSPNSVDIKENKKQQSLKQKIKRGVY